MRSFHLISHIVYILILNRTFVSLSIVYVDGLESSGLDIGVSADTIVDLDVDVDRESDSFVTSDASATDQVQTTTADIGDDDESIIQNTMISVSEEMTKGKFSEAEKILFELIQRHPNYIDAYIQLGRVKANLGNINEAKELYEYVIDYLDESYPPVYLALGKLSLFEQDYANTEELFGISWNYHQEQLKEKKDLKRKLLRKVF